MTDGAVEAFEVAIESDSGAIRAKIEPSRKIAVNQLIKLIELGPREQRLFNKPVRVLNLEGAQLLIHVGSESETWEPRRLEEQPPLDALPPAGAG